MIVIFLADGFIISQKNPHFAEQFRLVGFKFGQHDRGFECKHATVPEKISSLDIFLGGGQIGLFNKSFEQQSAVGHFLSCLYISVAGLRVMRPNTEGHDKSVIGQCNGSSKAVMEGVQILNDVIGRQDA